MINGKAPSALAQATQGHSLRARAKKAANEPSLTQPRLAVRAAVQKMWPGAGFQVHCPAFKCTASTSCHDALAAMPGKAHLLLLHVLAHVMPVTEWQSWC